MARLSFLLALLVALFSGAISKYVQPASSMHAVQSELGKENFDFDHLANTLNEREIFKPASKDLQNESDMPRVDLGNFFEKLNYHASEYAQLAKAKTEDISDDSEYQPLEKEQIDQLTKLASSDESKPISQSTVSEMFNVILKKNPFEQAYNLKGPIKKEDECPVGTIYTYFMSGKLKKCVHFDVKKIAIRLFLYRLTSPLENPPTKAESLLEAIAAPVLNRSSSLVVVSSIVNSLKEYDIKKPLKLTWPFVWLGNSLRNKQMALQYLAPGNQPNLSTYEGYATFLDEYREKQYERLFGIFPMKDFIHYPLVEYPAFEDITRGEKWQSDEVFSQQRLAGLNPMSLRILNSTEDPVKEFFNKSFDWNSAMKEVAGETFQEMVKKNSVFVLDYPLLHGIDNMENIEINDPAHREMRKSVSPIAVFASVTGKNGNALKPVAIQMDRDTDAPVFTPGDGAKWLMAKEEVQRADITYVEIIEHLLKSHLLMEPICIIMLRTFSELHPLRQLFSPHCKYTSVTNSVGVPALFGEKEFLHKLFSIGNTGSLELLNKGYKEMTWEDTDFEANLKKRGVMNDTSLPYFPYRDDGMLLWEKVGEFAEKYVNLYYRSVFEIKMELQVLAWGIPIKTIGGEAVPAPIATDIELQSFAMQLSHKKIGIIPGGRFKGFPSLITSKDQLIDMVKRILFIPIQHSAINYPISYYGAFTPNMPTKLYDPDTQDFTISNLPYYNIAVYQPSIAMILGSIRYDKFFDYSKDMKDERAATLVKEYHDELHGAVNEVIFERNCQRKLDNKFIYPYLMPQWLTNSIQT